MCYRVLTNYKYATSKEHIFQTDIVGKCIQTEYICLDATGKLTIKLGYCWNGANVAPDTDAIMRGSLVHDALYQLIRMKQLPDKYKDNADKLLKQFCLEDGMSGWYADCVYQSVKRFGCGSCKPGTEFEEKKYHFVTLGADTQK